MLHSLDHLIGSSVRCLNDEFGRLYDTYISEKTWRVAYFVIQTGSWLQDRRVLVSPAELHTLVWSDGIVFVDLTRQQVLDSPPIDAAKPVSRHQEELMNAYFGWPAPWSPARPPLAEPLREERPSNIRSLRELQGYTMACSDRTLGKVVDLVGEEPCWNVPYLVLETGGLSLSKRFCPSRAVTDIDWAERLIHVSAPASAIVESPVPSLPEMPESLFAAEVERHYRSRESEG